jgi:glutamine amidotransferase
MIGIIDYGVGNLKNVQSAVKRLGYDCVVSDKASELADSAGLILPGVGAFGDSIDMLNQSGLRGFVDDWAAHDRLMLGICVGMQLMFERSHEMGIHEGLGYLKGEVIPFRGPLKIPHMGWNQLVIVKDSPLVKDIESGEYVYFVHSYYGTPAEENLIAYTEYGVQAAAIVQKGNLFATQFHPEKSASAGSKILKNFLELTK